MENKWKDAVGKFCIVRKFWSSMYDEVKVVRISPKGDKIKLQWESGHQSWDDIDEYGLEEIL